MVKERLILVFRVHHGYCKEKIRARIFDALRPNFSTMGLNNMLANRKPQPRPSTRTCPVCFVKSLKDTIDSLLCDAHTVIANLKDHHLPILKGAYVDPSAIRGEFNGVMDQVDKDLRDTIRISKDHWQVRRTIIAECETNPFCLQSHAIDWLLDQAAGFDVLKIKVGPP